MFGCLRRFGCLALILIIACALWFTRDQWRTRVFGERTSSTLTWHAVSAEGSDKARASVGRLSRASGPVFVNLTAEELGSLLLSSAGNRMPSAVTLPQIAVSGDHVFLRANVKIDQLRGIGDLGPLTSMLKREEPFEASGTLDIVRPGLAEFRVESAKIGDLPIPRPMIPKLVARMSRAERYPGAADNAIPFEVPSYIGDVRVARGRVTLYKTVK